MEGVPTGGESHAGATIKINRQVFAHKDEFDRNFFKVEPPVKTQGK